MKPADLVEGFREAMRRTASSVAILATDGPAGRAGVTVSTLCSLSLEPPSVIACVHQQSRALPTILANEVFTANVLAANQEDIARAFAGQSPAFREDRFACAKWSRLTSGAPVLEGALASFDCYIAAQTAFGSHRILIGEVVALATHDVEPLVYADRAFRRLNAA